MERGYWNKYLLTENRAEKERDKARIAAEQEEARIAPDRKPVGNGGDGSGGGLIASRGAQNQNNTAGSGPVSPQVPVPPGYRSGPRHSLGPAGPRMMGAMIGAPGFRGQSHGPMFPPNHKDQSRLKFKSIVSHVMSCENWPKV